MMHMRGAAAGRLTRPAPATHSPGGTRAPLATPTPTTVWPMKSKATAYRERAVCRQGCRTPIRYLRRAAELSASTCAGACGEPAGLPGGVPGLTPEVVDYLVTHPSSIYDFQGLSRFAAALASGGHRDLAAGLYTKLLQLGGDSAQQVEALQGLLACWGGPEEEEEDEEALVERLAQLSCGEGPEGCRPARLVDVLLAAGLPEEVVVRFCEHILSSGRVVCSTVYALVSLSGARRPLARLLQVPSLLLLVGSAPQQAEGGRPSDGSRG
ncbi:hypothetical protein TSOC_014101 [Tetrabaena socialis]|uniref:Uncharacterized protein n=1 Tax=Tetrabaena socialis TaxID=47790 RepID=A0A2J7ZII2_9CHLO|nr:hypothetical protein TSOC_014101 [Tetrabaena socialis]|eukprot:PNH00085.1 hypothetical protein TSOC_014101 [Tetrabaena socialis]